MLRIHSNSLIALLAMLCAALFAGCPAGDAGSEEQGSTSAQADRPPEVIEEGAGVTGERAEDGGKPVYNPEDPLAMQLQMLSEQYQLPEDLQEDMAIAMDEVLTEEFMLGLPETGDQAPPFTLPADAGGAIALETAYADGPVLLLFFRGGW